MLMISQPEKTYDTVVFGTKSQCVALESIIPETGSISSLDDIEFDRPVLALFYEGWIEENPDLTVKRMKGPVNGDSAIAAVNSSFDWSSLDIPISYPLSSANVVSVVKTVNGTSCFSCICESDKEAMTRLIAWSDAAFSAS